MKFRIKLFSAKTCSFAPVLQMVSEIMSVIGCTAYATTNTNIYVLCYFYMLSAIYFVSVGFSFLTILTEEDLDKRFKAVIQFCGVMSSAFKITFFWYWRRSQWRLKQIAVKNTGELDHGTAKEKYIGIRNRKLANAVVQIIFSTYMLAYLSLILFPLISGDDYALPLHYTIPGVSYLSSSGYVITYGCVVLQLLYAVLAVIGFDTSFYVFCLYIVSRLEICILNCSHIGDKSGRYNTEEKQKELIKHIAELFSESYEFLRECSKIYGVCILVSSISATGMFAVSLVHLVVSSSPGATTFEIIAVSVQFFLYSFFGQLILSKGTAISCAIYNSKWYELESISNRKMILFLLKTSQRAPGFTFGGFSILSLQSFTIFGKTCYTIAAFILNVISQ